MSGNGPENPNAAPVIPDPRIPYDPLNEIMRFEMVLTRDGFRVSFPPAHLDALFWKFYVILADLAKSQYGYTLEKPSLMARGVPPPPQFRP